MKRIILAILVIAMLTSVLSACTKMETGSKNHNTGMPTQVPGTTNAVSFYRPGEWTTGGYTSEWLNMLYDRPWVWEITSDSIAISKEFDSIRKAEDPYFDVTEMRFDSPHKNGYTSAGSITLMVGLMENGDQTVRAYADESESLLQAEYEKLGAKREILAKGEAEIVFLGEKYLVRYEKTNILGKEWETCTLYLIKDNHVVRLVNHHLSDRFDITNTFKGFSALNGENYSNKCSVCNQEVSYEIISAGLPMCLECYFNKQGTQQPGPDQTIPGGLETTVPTMAPCDHNYKDATCTEPKTCIMCGATTGSAVGHTWKNATCTTPPTCTTCQETWGSANGHSWRDATCSAPKTCQTCQTTEGSALPHNMYYTKCIKCNHTDFSEYTLTSNTFCLDSWFYLDDGNGIQYLEDGEASINIDSNGVCKVTFDKYSYTFTLVQSEFDVYGLHFKCYMNGEYVENAEVTFYFSQNRCEFFLYGGTLGFSQVALNFDM